MSELSLSTYARIALIFSGAASLMYQLAWTRRLITVTSASATAQALILAVFMAGLGVGAWIGGRKSAAAQTPARAYAMVEAVAAALAVLAFPVFSLSDSLRVFVVQHGNGSIAVWLQLSLLSLYLLLPTTLLGASLPFLIEAIERNSATAERGRSTSSLYTFNTVGAGAGCLTAGFVTIEHVGLLRTTLVGAALALVGAGIVLRASSDASSSVSFEEEKHDSTTPRSLLLVAALSGFLGVGGEVLWTRLFALIAPNTVYTFTQVLFSVLAGIAAGAALASVLAKRAAQQTAPHEYLLRRMGWFSVFAAVWLAVLPLAMVWLAMQTPMQRALASGRSITALLVVMACLVPVSALIASILPLLVQVEVQQQGARPAGSFGTLYASNVLGSVLGSLLAGFVFLPALGLKLSETLLSALSLLLAALLLTGRERVGLLGAGAVLLAVLHTSHNVPQQIYERHAAAGLIVREFREGTSSHVLVTEHPQSHERRLWINSYWVAGSAGPHRVFGLLPGLFHPRPTRVLGIALGTGQTFAAALRHGAQHLDCVELDEGVVALADRWFGSINGHLLTDARVRVHIEDGRTFLRSTRERYDLLVLEPLQAWSAGTSNLYSREFYEEARRVLAPGAVIAQWIPFYGQGAEETRAMVRAGVEVFPQASLWLSGRDGVLLLSDAPFRLSFDQLQQRINERELQQDIAMLPARTPEDVLPYLLLGPEGLARWVRDAPLLEDDRPFLEFRAASQIGTLQGVFGETLASALSHMDPLDAYVRGNGLSPERIAGLQRARSVLLQMPFIPPATRRARLETVPEEGRSLLLWQLAYRNTTQ